jgi:hypothetical protein
MSFLGTYPVYLSTNIDCVKGDLLILFLNLPNAGIAYMYSPVLAMVGLTIEYVIHVVYKILHPGN